MKWIVALVLGVGMSCAYDSPTVPTRPPSPPVVPAGIAIASLSGIGNGYGQLFIGAFVTDARGVGIGPVDVTFTTTAGAFTESRVASDAGGLAQTVLASQQVATITARAGSATASLVVTPILAVPPVVSTPQPPDQNPDSDPPRSPEPAPSLSLFVSCTPKIHGTPSACDARPFYGRSFLSGITTATWSWGDLTADDVVSTTATSHTYASGGAYVVTVTTIAATPDGPRTATATRSIAVP